MGIHASYVQATSNGQHVSYLQAASNVFEQWSLRFPEVRIDCVKEVQLDSYPSFSIPSLSCCNGLGVWVMRDGWITGGTWKGQTKNNQIIVDTTWRLSVHACQPLFCFCCHIVLRLCVQGAVTAPFGRVCCLHQISRA